jgi:hypothetical protein
VANARGQLSGHRASGRAKDAGALLRQTYDTEVHLFPDAQDKTLAARLHHLTEAAHDKAVRHLCHELNATETLFPGTDLRLIYKIGRCQFSWGVRGSEVMPEKWVPTQPVFGKMRYKEVSGYSLRTLAQLIPAAWTHF